MRIHIVIDRRTVANALQKVVSRPVWGVALIVAILATGGVVFAVNQTATNTFQTGELVSSGLVNANFAELFGAVAKLRNDLDAGIYRGPKGDTGDKGPQGDQGDKGPKGDVGDQGPAGDEKEIPGSRAIPARPGSMAIPA